MTKQLPMGTCELCKKSDTPVLEYKAYGVTVKLCLHCYQHAAEDMCPVFHEEILAKKVRTDKPNRTPMSPQMYRRFMTKVHAEALKGKQQIKL